MPPDGTWPIWPMPLCEPRGLGVIVPMVLLIVFAYWSDKHGRDK